jgi:DNA ligase-1
MYDGQSVMNKPFYKRLELLPSDSFLKPVPHQIIKDIDDLFQFENKCLESNYEGIMLRDPEGIYKQGRSTFNEGLLFKLKRFSEYEADVIAIEEQMTNTNEKVRDELGYAERSTHMANLLPANTLGKMLVEFGNELLPVGCGCMTHDERKFFWNNPDKLVGKKIVVRHFQVGLDGYRPRHPRFVGFREDGR